MFCLCNNTARIKTNIKPIVKHQLCKRIEIKKKYITTSTFFCDILSLKLRIA